MLIIPAINCRTREAALEQINLAASFVYQSGGWIHIDIDKAGDDFAPSVSWGSPGELAEIAHKYSHINFEVHLMFEHAEGVVKSWLESGAKRVIIHLEATKNAERIAKMCKQFGADAMLSITPRTPVEWLKKYMGIFHHFQFLAVSPGPSGQGLDPKTPERIKFLREYRRDAKIEVDGGINPITAKQVKAAGADMAVSASYIFESNNPEAAYKELTNI